MKRVFVCSPYRGNTTRNREFALRVCQAALKEGFAPFAPHLIYPLVLDDDDAVERTLGIGAGLAYLGVCDELWVYLPPGRELTEGMLAEIAVAERYGIKVVVRQVRRRQCISTRSIPPSS